MQLLLASTSPYRKALLERLQLPFDTRAPRADETPNAAESPPALAERLAMDKAASLQSEYNAQNVLIIGSDQVATLDGQTPIGKPITRDRARRQLAQASGRSVRFFTGLSVLNARTGQHECLVDSYLIHFRNLTAQEIETYLDRESPLDCAGSFKAEGLGSALFLRHEGDDPTALIGLPLIGLCRLLQRHGYPVLGRRPQ